MTLELELQEISARLTAGVDLESAPQEVSYSQLERTVGSTFRNLCTSTGLRFSALRWTDGRVLRLRVTLSGLQLDTPVSCPPLSDFTLDPVILMKLGALANLLVKQRCTVGWLVDKRNLHFTVAVDARNSAALFAY